MLNMREKFYALDLLIKLYKKLIREFFFISIFTPHILNSPIDKKIYILINFIKIIIKSILSFANLNLFLS